MRKLFPFFLLCVLFCRSQQRGVTEVTMNTLLKDMTDFEAVTRFPVPAYSLKQSSSYDRKSISADLPGWFANGDFNQYIRVEHHQGRTEYVMMDADGPGCIVRFWLTALEKKGTMRFYFDGVAHPEITIPAFDLMQAGFNLGPGLLGPHSSYEPEGKGGNTLYLPLPYQKHCKVTWEYRDTISMKTPHYYQINYRSYLLGTKVETFRKQLLTAYRPQIDATEKRLWHPSVDSGKGQQLLGFRKDLATGTSSRISLPEMSAGTAHAIRSLSIGVHCAGATDSLEREKIWRQLVLKIDFDGQQTVYCPLGDFIGSGYGGHRIKSWYRDLTTKKRATARWVMPYQKSAAITLINKSRVSLHLELSVQLSPFNWTKNTLYFHATYKYEEDIKDAKWDYDLNKVAEKDPEAPIDWNFIRIEGRGVYLGNTLAVNNHMNSWYGEGDAKAYVDNETFPSEFGTGLEDYYNTSWAPVVLYQTPFANAPRADNPNSKGYNTFTRTRVLDGIPFTKAFSFDMEMLSWDGGLIDAAATTYWYGAKDATVIKKSNH